MKSFSGMASRERERERVLINEHSSIHILRTKSHGFSSPMSHVPSLTHVSRVPTFEPQNYSNMVYIYKNENLNYFMQNILGTCVENTSPKSHLQKVLPCRHSCHNWKFKTWNPCEVVSPNFHSLNDWVCSDSPQVNWDLGLVTPCEHTLSFHGLWWLTPTNRSWLYVPKGCLGPVPKNGTWSKQKTLICNWIWTNL